MKLSSRTQKEKSLILNRKTISILIAVIFVLSALFAFIFYKISTHSNPNQASVTLIGVTKVNAGQKLTMPIFIDTKGQNINAAEVYLNFNPRLMRVDDISTDGSFFKIWIEDHPKYSNEQGTIAFAGGLPKPGFTGQGQIGTITVTLLKDENATLVFTPKTRVLLNDGKATPIPLSMDPITIRVK